MLEWRLKAFRHWLTMTEPDWANVHHPPIDYQAISYYSAPKSPGRRAEEPGRGRSEAAGDLREAGHPAARARAAGRRRRGRGVRQRLGGHHLQGRSWPKPASSSAPSPRRCSDHPELVQQVPGHAWCRTGDNFFAALNSRGVHRRLLRLHPQGRALPHGAVHLLPHQRRQHRPVRAHPDRRRGGQPT